MKILVIFLLSFTSLVLISCKEVNVSSDLAQVEKERNVSSDLIYPELAHLEKKTPYSNKVINDKFESCIKLIESDTLYVVAFPDSLSNQYCTCFVEKAVTKLTKLEMSDQDKVYSLSQDCFVSLGIWNIMNGNSQSKPDRDNYKKELMIELEHLRNVNGWEIPVINSIYENCITNQPDKSVFVEFNLLSEFNDYCICLTESIVTKEKQTFLISDLADSKIVKYKDSCIPLELQSNPMGWGPGDISDMIMVFRKEKSIIDIANQNDISANELAECIVNNCANTIPLEDLTRSDIGERIGVIIKKCIT